MDAGRLRLVVVVLFSVIVYVTGQDVEYSILEEAKVGYEVGDIPRDTNLNVNPGAKLQFSILTEGNRYSELFLINSAGILSVKSRINRETLCPFQITCKLQIEIIARSTALDIFRNLKIEITVKDINDNAPKFPVQSRKLEIPESSTIGSSFTLPGASDNDTDPNNSLQSVEIIPSNVPFRVEFTKNLDGTSVVLIIVTEKLDRETTNTYNVKLMAEDGGVPPLSSSMDVLISITDVNDNSPVFSHSIYNVTIKENTNLEMVILQVTANDEDEGENGNVFYRLSSHQADEIHRYFAMDNMSGNMVLKQQLNSGHIKVIIEASDRGTPPKISQAFVEVEILDTINNPPAITINILSETGTAKVLESVRIGFPVAHIKILDPDTGANGIVTCFSQTAGFDLQPLDDKEYKAVVAKHLDYETTTNYKVMIFCRDAGSPKLNASAEFNVEVLDANDNSPEFMQNEVVLNIAENNAVGDMIVQLGATDKDSGINKKLTFSVLPEARVNFTVDTNIPIVRTKIRFDREDTAQYQFHVLAIDGGVPSRTATATITVNVLDINDEQPQFLEKEYRFHIPENLPLGMGVGNVSAFDRDTEDGGIFSLKLSQLTSTAHLPFTILQNGTILTTEELDREEKNKYIFSVVATDHGTMPLSGSAQVTVVVDDVNDNDPSFVFPNDDNYSVSVFIPSKSGSVVVRVQATDRDDGSNAQIKYTSRDLNSSGLFEMNNTSGEIYTTRDIDTSMIGTYYLAVMISNTNPDAKSVSQRLKILISHRTQPGDFLQSSDQYIIIVIVLVCSTLFIAAAILVALCYLRKRDKDHQLKKQCQQEPLSYSLQTPVSTVDGVTSTDKATTGHQNVLRSDKKADLDTSSSTVNGKIISTGNCQHQRKLADKVPSHEAPANTTYSTNVEHVVPDREHQRQNQLMSFRLHQALQRLNSETSTQEQNKIMAANAKVIEWRDAQKRADDFHSTSSGEITTGDSGHGSDEDSHILSERSTSPQKIRLGIGAIKHQTNPGQITPPRSKVSPIKGTKMAVRGRNGQVLYPSHFNLTSKKDNVVQGGFNPYTLQTSPRSEIEDGDDTTTSGSYSITLDDTKSELPEFDYIPVKDVYV
ncbi:protocadherin alpha-11-like [Haliotis rubra]|uniref:protocadherin alpha-11-like n=1 Tax=Haliotis rubra TaxID=36100 RepID=UPI001EE5F5C7|nr:protocadherin alpha-11-like [Haliotis rubra]